MDGWIGPGKEVPEAGFGRARLRRRGVELKKKNKEFKDFEDRDGTTEMGGA